MKVKFIRELSNTEIDKYKRSELYSKVTTDYSLCDVHKSYYIEYFGDKYQDNSLIVFDDNNFYLAAYIFNDLSKNELSKWGSAIPIFYIEMEMAVKKKVISDFFSKMESLWNRNSLKSIQFRDNPFFLERYFENNLKFHLEHNAYIDLNQTESDIKMAIRKSYKSLVNWGYRNMVLKVYDSSNYKEDIIRDFEQFHIKVAGRRTRSHKSWVLQGNAVKEKMGIIVMGYLNDSLVSAVYVCLSKTEAYYGVAVNDRELMAQNLPIGHATLMEAIIQSKKHGISKFNLGNVEVKEDPKLQSISKYKRGFTGEIETKLVYSAKF